jgi:hypothetical protein
MFARVRHHECAFPMTDRTSSQKLVSQRNRKHTREVVIARPGKTHFGHSGSPRDFSERPERLDSYGNIGVLKTEKPLSPAAFSNDQATREKLR